jgi:hypothetical protein
MDFNNTVILTGAGFTANFGGFLAKEMWSKIFNNPLLDNAGIIKLALRDNFDFEEMYSSAFDDRKPYPEGELKLYKQAVTEAYLAMNDYLLGGNIQISANPKNVLDFLNTFLRTSDGKVGAYFTLNQDMFPETTFDWKPFGPNVDHAVKPNTPVKLPTQAEVDSFMASTPKIDLCYAKLHGSVNWLQEDESETMVIGINKLEAINKVPLLKYYFQLFNQAINRKGTKILIIGYGFRDEHINKCLFDAINNSGLQLYVISSEDPGRFKRKLTVKGTHEGYNGIITEQNNDGITIWRAIQAYFPYKLSGIFPESGARTAAHDEILKTFFH